MFASPNVDVVHITSPNKVHVEQSLAALRAGSSAWRLLRADNAPLVLSFLGRVFVDDNVRDISASQLINRLDDELYALNERLGEGTYPKSAKAYLDDWAAPEAGPSDVDSAVRAGSRWPIAAYRVPRPWWQWATSGSMPSSSAKARACW